MSKVVVELALSMAAVAAIVVAVPLMLGATPATPPGAGGVGPRGRGPTADAQPTGGPKSPVADGAKVIHLANGFAFTEGATSNKDGNVFFIDQPNDAIMEWEFTDPTDPSKGKLSTFMKPSGRSNGMCFDADGNLISCADEKNELWSISPDKKVTVLIKDYQGKPMNGPNDLWIIPTGPLKGGMFITDPLYARDWWTDRPGGKGMQQPGKYVYYFSADHKTLVPIITDLRTPNGIMGTPDGKTLYVGDYDGQVTYSYSIKDDGTVANKKPFCNVGSDGMTIDSDGNLYTTMGNAREGLTIWDKNGVQIDRVAIGCANVCFGGKNKDILFVNSSNEVWALKMKTHGVGPS